MKEREGAAEAKQAAMFTIPEAVRNQPIRSAEILEFQIIWEGLQMVKESEIDEFGLTLITNGASDCANTVYLRELADW